jgi:hypothetical protein
LGQDLQRETSVPIALDSLDPAQEARGSAPHGSLHFFGEGAGVEAEAGCCGIEVWVTTVCVPVVSTLVVTVVSTIPAYVEGSIDMHPVHAIVVVTVSVVVLVVLVVVVTSPTTETVVVVTGFPELTMGAGVGGIVPANGAVVVVWVSAFVGASGVVFCDTLTGEDALMA